MNVIEVIKVKYIVYWFLKFKSLLERTARRANAGLCVTQRSILGFFAPQGQRVAPMKWLIWRGGVDHYHWCSDGVWDPKIGNINARLGRRPTLVRFFQCLWTVPWSINVLILNMLGSFKGTKVMKFNPGGCIFHQIFRPPSVKVICRMRKCYEVSKTVPTSSVTMTSGGG